MGYWFYLLSHQDNINLLIFIMIIREVLVNIIDIQYNKQSLSNPYKLSL
jgi:hypothetical protein